MAICSNRLYVENWRTRYVLREFWPQFGHACPVGGLRGACAELRSLSRRLKTIGGLRGACAELSALSRRFAVVLVAVWDARRLRRAK